MKKTKRDFKTLSRKETRQVKGGGWLSNMINSITGDTFNGNLNVGNLDNVESRGYCPPPEPQRS